MTGDGCAECNKQMALDIAHDNITALERENKALREALSLMGPPHCDHLHHNKRDRHDWQTACPVEARINALSANSEGGA
jgi:hypothetical protein